eukprot:m51a1_g9682 hypothetical protein (353) ;mRNA; f:1298967-1300472
MQRTVLMALCVAAVACAFELRFTPHNWTQLLHLRPLDAGFHHVGAQPLLNPLTKGSLFYSLNADAAAHLFRTSRNANISADAGAMVAYGCVATGHLVPSVPVSAYTYFDSDYLANFGLDLNNLVQTSGAVAAGAVAMAFEKIVEVDQNGNELSSRSLLSRTFFGHDGMEWAADGHGDSSEHPGAKFYRVRGTDSTSGLTVAFTWVASSVPGYTELGNTVLVPRAFQTIVEIRNYPYTGSNSKLRLRIVGANARAAAQAGKLVSTSGVRAYAEAGARAVVDGVEAHVEVGAWADYTIEALRRLVMGAHTPLQGVWHREDVKRVDVEFPAGAKVIVYSPVLATGTSPNALSIDA